MREGKENRILGPLLFYLYGFCGGTLKRIIRDIVLKIEGGMIYSITIRRIFKKYHRVEVGSYSYGFINPYAFHPGTIIGRYTSLYPTVQAFNANHPMNTKSTHAFFFNEQLGYAKHNLLKGTKLRIGNDVFIGHNVIISPSCREIGDGAYIGAGTLVNKDVPPFAVVLGYPGRIVRYRFPQETIQELLESKWWEKSIEDLLDEFDEFTKPLDGSNAII